MDGFPNFGTKPKAEPSGPAVWCQTSEWDPSALPVRPWITLRYLLRGSVTTIVGPAGVSKSSLVLAWAVSGALHKEFGSFKPKKRFRSLVYNVEDDADEQMRRLTGVLTSFGGLPAAVTGWIGRTGPTDVGTLFDRDENGDVFETRAMRQLDELLEKGEVDVLFVDPLAELHNVEENDNGAMRAIVAAFRRLAKKRNIAVVIIHHTRKGLMVPGDPDSGRGASSVVGASRVVLTITGMTEDEAKAFGLSVDTRKHYFRLDGGKANYSSLTDCEWFERVTYTLENGDDVSVPRPWKPPVDAVTPEQQVKVEAAMRRGSSQGPWSPQLGNTPRSVKHALVEAGIITVPGQKDMLAALFRDGFVQVRFRDPRRKWSNGIRSPDGQPSNVEWEDEAACEGGE